MKIETITISEEHHKRLMSANAGMAAIQKMMDMFSQHCQAKMEAHQKEVNAIWLELKDAHDLDLERVLYSPHPKEPKIVPVQVMLADQPKQGM